MWWQEGKRREGRGRPHAAFAIKPGVQGHLMPRTAAAKMPGVLRDTTRHVGE